MSIYPAGCGFLLVSYTLFDVTDGVPSTLGVYQLVGNQHVDYSFDQYLLPSLHGVSKTFDLLVDTSPPMSTGSFLVETFQVNFLFSDADPAVKCPLNTIDPSTYTGLVDHIMTFGDPPISVTGYPLHTDYYGSLYNDPLFCGALIYEWRVAGVPVTWATIPTTTATTMDFLFDPDGTMAGVLHTVTLTIYFGAYTGPLLEIPWTIDVVCPPSPIITETAIPAALAFSHYYGLGPVGATVHGGQATTTSCFVLTGAVQDLSLVMIPYIVFTLPD